MRTTLSLTLLLALAAAGPVLAQPQTTPPPPPVGAPPPPPMDALNGAGPGHPDPGMNGPGMNKPGRNDPDINGPGMRGSGQGMVDEDGPPSKGPKLTADQRERVHAILEDTHRQAEALRAATRQKLAAVLTPEQLEAWEARHPHPGRHGAGQPPEPPPPQR